MRSRPISLNSVAKQWRRQEVARRGLCPGCNCKPFCPGCAPAGKPSSFDSDMQHQFFAFHSTILHNNRGQHFGAHGTRRQDFESKFWKFFRSWHPRAIFVGGAGGATPSLTHARGACTPLLGPRPSYPHRNYGAHLSQQEYILLAPPQLRRWSPTTYYQLIQLVLPPLGLQSPRW